MRRLILRLTLLGVAALLVAAAPASAQDCEAPPGTAAIDEYCETIPSAAGGEVVGTDGLRAPPAIPRATVRALDRAGPDGKALNRFLGQDPNAPARKGERAKPLPLDGGVDQKAPSSNPLDAIRSAVSSGATVGDGFVWVMLAITLLMVGIAWTRYRRDSAS
jgi:hypothetical protein